MTKELELPLMSNGRFSSTDAGRLEALGASMCRSSSPIRVHWKVSKRSLEEVETSLGLKLGRCLSDEFFQKKL